MKSVRTLHFGMTILALEHPLCLFVYSQNNCSMYIIIADLVFDAKTFIFHIFLQVLELGIVSHSIIIGFSLGVSQSPCSIRPLIGALSFHQFFEGFALGGCISQAQFHTLHTTLMACFFAVTTPIGIAIGTAVSSFYNPNSPRALVIEGIFDSISAGILVYMALVDLIAADFMSKRMKCNVRLQIVSYFTLFLGAGLMSLLAIWA